MSHSSDPPSLTSDGQDGARARGLDVMRRQMADSYEARRRGDLPVAVPAAQRPAPGMRRSFPALRTISALILREMSTRYGRSVGGYIWALAEPLAAVFLMAIGFSLLIRSPSLGSSFFLFYATGYLPFYLYQHISVVVARAILFSKPLLFYPAVTWLDSLLARFILNALTGIIVAYLTLLIVMLMLDTRTVIDIWRLIEATALALVLGLGVGAVNCALFGLYPTWEQVWSIITRPLFVASGVLYIYEDLPQVAQSILWWNPLLHITGLFRQGLYSTYAPQYISVPFVLITSVALMAFGLLLLRRYHRDILEQS